MVLSRLMLPYPFHIYIKIRYLLNVLTELARSDSDPDRYDERIIINYSGKFFRWSHQCLLESKWKTLQIGALSFHQCFEITHTQCNQWALMQKQKGAPESKDTTVVLRINTGSSRLQTLAGRAQTQFPSPCKTKFMNNFMWFTLKKVRQ